MATKIKLLNSNPKRSKWLDKGHHAKGGYVVTLDKSFKSVQDAEKKDPSMRVYLPEGDAKGPSGDLRFA